MSGILLPGGGKGQDKEQPKQPSAGGSGIEIAKGFSRPPKKEAAAPAAAESAPAAPQSQQPQPQRRGGGQGQGMDLLFPPAGGQIACPNCGTPYTVPIFTIVDLGANPELRQPLLGGQINLALCPNCGMGGPLSAPLMVHDPEHNFLGVFMPAEGGLDDIQRQRIIGELTQTLMRKLPSDARRGYMLQPRQFADWNRLMEVLWGFEGVTPEMLRRQRDQSAALQRLMALADDPKALDIALERDKALIDRQFFALLDRLLVMTRAQTPDNPLVKLRARLLESTPAGAEVAQREEKLRGLLNKITAQTTREDILETLVTAWLGEDGPDLVGAVAMVAAPLLDYQFLVLLTERIDATEDPAAKEKLGELREFVTDVQEQQRANQQAVVQQSQAVLQEVLQATDPKARLRELAEYVDEMFLSVLAGNIQQAEKNGASAAASRLRAIYEAAMEVVAEGMPDDLRLLNDLLSAPDKAAMRKLLKENKQLLTKDFLDSISALEEEMRGAGRAEMADRLKSLRGQVALAL